MSFRSSLLTALVLTSGLLRVIASAQSDVSCNISYVSVQFLGTPFLTQILVAMVQSLVLDASVFAGVTT